MFFTSAMNIIEKRTRDILKEYGIFIPLLLLYLLSVFLFSKNTFLGDEERYVSFADNLLHGFYSPSDTDNVSLWNGPGYPVILLSFAALKLPWITAKSANAFFLFGAVIFFYRTLCLYIRKKQAKFFALLFGLYSPFMSNLHFLYTETFTLFLITAFSFFFCFQAVHNKIFNPFLFVASAILAWLMLTKIIFGYIVLFILVFSAICCILLRSLITAKCFVICCFAILLCFPYLTYTYSLTGKIFYWSDSGGLSLYWMSTPYSNEYGDWHHPEEVNRIDGLAKNHGAFFNKIDALSPVKKDEALQNKAIQNIVKYPEKYLFNIACNISRMLVDYPFSYPLKLLKKYLWFFWVLPNAFIFIGTLLFLYPTRVARKDIPGEIFILILFGFSGFSASVLVPAYFRHFYVLVPFFGIWFGFLIFRVLNVDYRGKGNRTIQIKQDKIAL